MNEQFFCDICDKSVKIETKKIHLNSQLHKDLNKYVINRYRVENPDFFSNRKFVKKLCL